MKKSRSAFPRYRCCSDIEMKFKKNYSDMGKYMSKELLAKVDKIVKENDTKLKTN